MLLSLGTAKSSTGTGSGALMAGALMRRRPSVWFLELPWGAALQRDSARTEVPVAPFNVAGRFKVGVNSYRGMYSVRIQSINISSGWYL